MVKRLASTAFLQYERSVAPAEKRSCRSRLLQLGLLLLAFLAPSAASAHPMGFGTAEVVLSEKRYRVELVLDAPPEAVEERTADEKLAYEALLAQQLSEMFAMKFDGKVSSASVKILAVGTGATAIDVARITGPVPPTARQLVIGVGTQIGDLGVEIRGGALSATLRGLISKGEESAPIDLTGSGDNSDWSQATPKLATERRPVTAAAASSAGPASSGAADAVRSDGAPEARKPVDVGFGAMFRLGLRHIVPSGLDHVLFIIGLLLLNSAEPGHLRWFRRLGLQLTLFTLAHSVTLALGALGYVNAPPAIIEPLIALSIVYVGLEPLLADFSRHDPVGPRERRAASRRALTSPRSRWLPSRRTLVVLIFGLLHGLGFASVLAARGLSEGLLVRSLLAFNLGVEFGQLLVASAFAAVVFRLREHERYFRFVVLPCGLGISVIALVWFFERI